MKRDVLTPCAKLGIDERQLPTTSRHLGDLSWVWSSELAILSFVQREYRHSEARFCFSIVRDNQAKGKSTAGTLHGQVRRIPSSKGSFVELPIMEARIIAHSVFIGYCITHVNL
jgi:hypothetical protein